MIVLDEELTDIARDLEGQKSQWQPSVFRKVDYD